MLANIENLQKAGLPRNEAKVYLELLKQGELSANELSKKLGMDRTLTYGVINNLIEKGLINYIKRENKKIFRAEPPENLLNPLRKKRIFIKDLIKGLSKIKEKKDSDYEVKIYEGGDGFRTILRGIQKNKEYCSFGATGRAYDQIYEFAPIAKKLDKEGFTSRSIAHPKHKNHPMTKFKNQKFRYLDIESEATTIITGDYVSIHFLKNKPLLIMIKNKEIADTYRNYFNYLWKIAKK
jgi:HTH-type transcriptional regulator, sugar sensing transcriptional regulator